MRLRYHRCLTPGASAPLSDAVRRSATNYERSESPLVAAHRQDGIILISIYATLGAIALGVVGFAVWVVRRLLRRPAPPAGPPS